MDESRPSSKPKVRHKEFRYHTQVEWIGGRAATLNSTGKPELKVASPPEFKGEEGVWTPEDLFVASVEVCVMTTFLAFALRAELPLSSYRSTAEGLLEFVDGGYRFTTVTVRPAIRVERPDSVQRAGEILEEAHRKCLISNSIRAAVHLEPEIVAAK